MHAERVETEEQLAPAILRALANRPALLDMVVTPDAISSDGKTGLACVPDLQPLAGSGLITRIAKYDTNPANSPQPPKSPRKSG